MADIARPDYGVTWANAGEKIAPEPVKMNLGWVQEMMPFQYENWLQARQDEAITYIFQKGIAEYSSTQDYIANKSLALYQGAVYLATQNNLNVLPTVQANWKRISTISNNDGVVSVVGGGTGATTPEQARLNLGLGTAAVLDATYVVQKDVLGNFTAGTITASLNGTATSAQKLATARSITLSGAVTSTATMFDGSSNVTVITTSVDATKIIGQVPSASLGAAVTKTSATGSAELPSGTTAERDTVTKEGYLRYNKTSKLLEYWNGTAWIVPNGTDLGSLVGTGPSQISNNTMLDTRAVTKTSATGSARMPAGPTSARDVPAEGGFTRFNSETKKLEVYDGGAWVNIGGGAGGSIFDVAWHNGSRASITAGFIPADGQVIQFSDNPDVCRGVWEGKQNSVLDANWEANKNCWSRGDGATWVRVPNLNMADGSDKPFYLRGGPDNLNGTWVGDALKQHGHRHEGVHNNLGSTAGYSISRNGGNTTPGDKTGTGPVPTMWRDDEITVVVNSPTADETRVKTAYGVYVIRVFTEVSNTGAIDAATLATQIAVVDAKVQTLNTNVESLKHIQYEPEALWTGNTGAVIELTLSREVLEGETLILKHTTAGTGLTTPQFYLPSVAHQVDGGSYFSFSAGTVYTGCVLRKPAIAGGPSIMKMLSYTSGYGIAGIYAIKQKV